MAIDVITLQINHLGITTALIITFGAFEVQGGLLLRQRFWILHKTGWAAVFGQFFLKDVDIPTQSSDDFRVIL